MKKKPYSSIPLLPFLIAETVCLEKYVGQDISENARSDSMVAKIEEKRKKLTFEQIADFASKCDKRCEMAYDAKAKWFEDCINAKDNSGRDQLYVWMYHWMSSYLTNPEKFLSRD